MPLGKDVERCCVLNAFSKTEMSSILPAAPFENTMAPHPKVPKLSEVAVVSGSVSGTLVSWLQDFAGILAGDCDCHLRYGLDFGVSMDPQFFVTLRTDICTIFFWKFEPCPLVLFNKSTG